MNVNAVVPLEAAEQGASLSSVGVTVLLYSREIILAQELVQFRQWESLLLVALLIQKEKQVLL